MKVNKASIDDEFLRHPHSGAFIRNPLLDKTRTAPILFQSGEFDHNCLDDALAEYQCITVTEASFKEMTQGGEMTMGPNGEMTQEVAPPSPAMTKSLSSSKMSTLSRAALGRLRELPTGYEFVVALRKSSYVPPRNNRRRPVEAMRGGTLVDKVNIEVSDIGGKTLRVETINEGLIAVWNRTNPAFQIRAGDIIVKVNMVAKNSAGMIEELIAAPDALRVTVRRSPSAGGFQAVEAPIPPA